VQLALTYREQYLEDSAGYASRLGDALDAVARAEAVAPDDARVYNTKGIVLYEAGTLEEARTAFETAADVAAGDEALSNREVSTIRVNQGRVYRDLGDLELAAATFRRGVVDDPTNVAARNLLGNVLYRLDDCAGARYELSQAVTLAPTSLSAVSQLGIALFECGDPAASVPVLERALELEGAVFTPPLYTYLARAYLEQGRADDAVRRAQQGALLPPERADAHVVLGDAYLARGGDGDAAAAREAYQRALEIDPNDAAARDALDALD
jgi:Flp pilus assembly protein TadD